MPRDLVKAVLDTYNLGDKLKVALLLNLLGGGDDDGGGLSGGAGIVVVDCVGV